jgi:hypothetical protein
VRIGVSKEVPVNVRKVSVAALVLAAVWAGSAGAGPLPFDKGEYAARRARLMGKTPDGAAAITGIERSFPIEQFRPTLARLANSGAVL